MSRKPKPSQASDKSSGFVVRLPLSPAEMAALKAEALAHDRPVSAEIARRVLGKAPVPSPFANWPAADAADFQAVGDAVALLLAEVTLVTGTKTELKKRLGYLKPAIAALLDEVGAEDVQPADEKFFAGITHGLLRDGSRVAAIPEITELIRQRINIENEAKGE